ncbi:hypothetical protein Q8F55_003959 [Vanrija albida]|uniref:PH domain-containing protein n=1 Tax=Vanrija albida TaxID=181172 RepID=A0ABR3Q5E9_9TREE
MASTATPIPQRGTPSRGQGELATSPATSLLASSAPSSALYNFRLLAALRSGFATEVQPFIDELATADPNSDAAHPGRLLGMAARVATIPIVQQILNSPNLKSPNLPVAPDTTATALHVASEVGRPEVVELLLNDPRIDDTIRDEQGRTPLECAATSEVVALIADSRAALQARFQSLLASYTASPLNSVEEGSTIVNFLENPRTASLNLNVLDAKSGTSLLHEAAHRRDLRLVELIVKRGADVFVRDRRGKRVLEHDKSGDERIRAYLKQFSNRDSIIQPKSDGRPPDLRGFLSKWVNYRQGWKTRWFVLENGVLSYYRTREDEQVACRGSIALANAQVVPNVDGTRFEVSSSTHTHSGQKFIMKSNLRGEIARWIQALRLNIEYYQKGGKGSQGPAVQVDRSDSRSVRTYAPSIAATTGTERALGSSLNELPPSDGFLHPGLQRSNTNLSGRSGRSGVSVNTPALTPGLSINSPGTPQPSRSGRTMSKGSQRRNLSPASKAGTLSEDALDNSDQDSIETTLGDQIPHEEQYELGIHNLKAQLELTEQLVGSIVTPPSTPDPNRLNPAYTRQHQVKEALRESLATLSQLFSKQSVMAQEREKFYLQRIKREVEARKLWEENLMAVAQQQAETDRLLNEAAQDNAKKRQALRQARGVLAELSTAASVETSPINPTQPLVAEPASMGSDFSPATPASPPRNRRRSSFVASESLRRSINGLPSSSLRDSVANIHEAASLMAAVDDSDQEDDDEFFDAIETGTIPNLRVYDSIDNAERPATPSRPADEKVNEHAAHHDDGTVVSYLARSSLEPYNHVRHRLPIDDDKRPSVSLWSILKSSIGKDLTKISFPVSFNECTSMLQRMAEDMEYDACLTVAAGEEDSLKRIAFVAAFAMSNYSSTIGRIAKPFNPMLSQSFEYAIPNRYRYVSEQVSHHPPISACYSEAPTWKYYGEVDAKNKFQGRYFEIRPTGVAHAELIIPESWVKSGLSYPKAGSEYPAGKVVEHYSWKKVTTNVSNFIMGNPIIDHYGDLVVTNHRTGETSTLTFKPRGWRGGNAFEIKGNVKDSGGNIVWDIAGRWDTQLIARRAGAGEKELDVNEQVEDTDEYIQLWRNTKKPPAPFNLTPYALTLNDIPKGLEEYLAPTDCRLRTDQRAFENAEYDKAQMLKSANEEKQRETRRLRAEGIIPPHEPRWFTSETDKDSGERVWIPKRADDGEVKFWHDREEQGPKPDGEKWTEVDHIFVEDTDA